ncbi:MAG: IPT/TIG domain-containing protein [Syntrophomonadales bacterium]
MIVHRHRRGSRIIATLLAVVFIMMQLLVVAPGEAALAAPVQGFSDVTSDNPNQPYITYVTKVGVISGFPDGTYRPASSLTRAQAAAIMVKSLNLDTAGITSSGFRDVPASHWAAIVIGSAVRAGLLAGYGDGTYRPDQPLTRAEGISLIFRLTKSAVPPTALPLLQDVSAGHWAAPQIAAALDAKMILLKSDRQFAPDVSMSRGELARALAMMLVLAPEFSDQSLTCQVTAEKGTVRIKKADEKEYQTVSKSGTLKPGDSVTTAADSIARLTFDDGTEIRMEPQTELTLTNNQGYRYIKQNGEPGVGVDDLRLAMKSGEVYFALAADPNRQESSQVSNSTTPPSRASTDRFFRQTTPAPSRAPAQTASSNSLPWWKKNEQVKTRLTFDMPVGMCGARSTFGNIVTTSGGGWSMNLANGSGFLQVGGRQTDVKSGYEGHVNSRGETRTQTMSKDTIAKWTKSAIATWMRNAAQQIDNNRSVRHRTTTQQQQQQTILQRILAAMEVMKLGHPPTDENVKKHEEGTLPPPAPQPGGGGGGGGGGPVQGESPEITSITPSSAEPGTNVTIIGNHFGTNQGTVSFGSAPATINTWSANTITAVIPDLSPGTVQVTVKQGDLTSNEFAFTVLAQTVPRPVITAIRPAEAPINETVVIEGSNFGTTNGVVRFGSYTAEVISWSATEITVNVPAGLRSGPVQVTVAQGNLVSEGFAFIILSGLQPPTLPHALYGSVKISGQDAPVGTLIVAKLGNQEIGRITVEIEGKYGEPVKMIIGSSGGIANGQEFTLYVDGKEVQKKVTFVPGGVSEISLTV